MPGNRWKGGADGWETDIALCVSRLRQSLDRLPISTGKQLDQIYRDVSFASCRFQLGAYEWWQGNEGLARELWAASAAATEALLERWLPTESEEFYTYYAEPAQRGAMAASMAGQSELARKLFSRAELLATGLLAEDSTAPVNPLDALDHPNAQRPYIRVYCLLRLGRLSGFNGYVYTVPLEKARNATPVWRSLGIPQALDTAHFCFELWRHKRSGLDSLKKKRFEPLLRALAACLSPGAGDPERLAARKALQAYHDAIHDLHLFFEMYPRVVDLQVAYPHLFG